MVQFLLYCCCGLCEVILGRHPASVHRTYGPFGCLTRDAASENGQKDLCTSPDARRTLQRSDGGSSPETGGSSCPSVERGKASVKRQTLILVMIGVILFIAGS